MGVTTRELINKAMAEATYCDRCEKDFTTERTKVEPDEQTVWWTGTAEVTCQECLDAEVDRYLDNLQS